MHSQSFFHVAIQEAPHSLGCCGKHKFGKMRAGACKGKGAACSPPRAAYLHRNVCQNLKLLWLRVFFSTQLFDHGCLMELLVAMHQCLWDSWKKCIFLEGSLTDYRKFFQILFDKLMCRTYNRFLEERARIGYIWSFTLCQNNEHINTSTNSCLFRLPVWFQLAEISLRDEVKFFKRGVLHLFYSFVLGY